jgi:glycosyltransferase involved in cell wall biosynthesis
MILCLAERQNDIATSKNGIFDDRSKINLINNKNNEKLGSHEKKELPKVLFIATVYTHLANFHIPFINLLQSKGYDVHAAASSSDGRREEIEATGACCHEIRFSRSPFSLDNLKAFWQLMTLLKSHSFELIHVHTPIAAFLGRLAAKLAKQGHVLYTAHGFHFYKGAPLLDRIVYSTAERIAAKWTDGLIVINDEDFANAARLGLKPDKNLFLVNGVGVDIESFITVKNNGLIRKELGISADAVVVVCVAEMIARKNQSFLLDAWKEIASLHGDVHLLFVGTGRDEDELKQKVKTQELLGIHFLGFRRDIPNILSDSDIAILTSKHEGLPKSLMEAMAAGKPVIATNVRGNRDLVDDGRTGLLVELGDLQGLVKALRRLISESQLRITFGSAGREKIANYSLPNILKEMTRIYDKYLKRASPATQ